MHREVIYKIIGTVGGIGYFPYGSGTFATIVFFPVIFIINNVYLSSFLFSLIFILGVISGNYICKKWGDASFFVIDEVAGVWISMLIIFDANIWFNLLSAIFFRIFDIFKPFPVNRFDNIKNGFGVMMDDVVSGIMSGILVRFIIIVWHILY